MQLFVNENDAQITWIESLCVCVPDWMILHFDNIFKVWRRSEILNVCFVSHIFLISAKVCIIFFCSGGLLLYIHQICESWLRIINVIYENNYHHVQVCLSSAFDNIAIDAVSTLSVTLNTLKMRGKLYELRYKCYLKAF